MTLRPTTLPETTSELAGQEIQNLVFQKGCRASDTARPKPRLHLNSNFPLYINCGGLCPNLPDPLESVFVAAGSTRFKSLPRRERRWVDLSGDNACRGWSGVSLRTQEDQDLNSVTAETKELIFQGVEARESGSAASHGSTQSQSSRS